MVTFSKYGRQSSSKEVGSMRIAAADAKRTSNNSYIVKNNYGFNITDFNRGIAVYRIAHIGLASKETIDAYVAWLKKKVVNFDLNGFTSGIAFAKRYVNVNKDTKGLEYRGDFDEDSFFDEWNIAIKENKKNGR